MKDALDEALDLIRSGKAKVKTTMATRLPTRFAGTTESLARAVQAFGPVRLVLPYPPSINALWRTVDGRTMLSSDYRAWMMMAGQELMTQRPKKLLGKVGISVDLKAPDKRRRDLDNVGFKAIIDLLVKHGIIEGDDSRFVRSIHANWVEDGHPCVVTIKPAVF